MFVSILASLVLYLLGLGRSNPFITFIGITGVIVLFLFLDRGDHHNNLLIMETISNRSPKKHTNPVMKLILALCIIIIVVGANSLVISLVTLIASIYHFIIINKTSYKYYLDFIHGPLIFIFLSILGIIISITKSPLGYIDIPIFSYFISITRTSQEKGIKLFLVSLSSVSVLINFAATTPMGDVIYALKKLKTPWVLIELMYLLYRYVFSLFYVFNSLQISARARHGFLGIKTSYKTSMMLATRLFNKSFYMARNSYNAMESRMYEGQLRFLEDNESSKDGLMYLVFLFTLVLIFILEKVL